MIKAQYKPMFVVSLILISMICILFSIWMLVERNYPISAIAFLSAVYILTKYFAIKKEDLIILEVGFQFRGKLIRFSEIDKITVLHQDSSITPNLKYYPLGNSAIYSIQLKTDAIQVVGKLYKNADNFMDKLAKKANITMQRMKD